MQRLPKTFPGSQNPTTCGADIAAALGDETTNQTLSFTVVNTACLYLGSSQMFRGVGFEKCREMQLPGPANTTNARPMCFIVPEPMRQPVPVRHYR